MPDRRRREKQLLFHESLINILYPPPPPNDDDEEEKLPVLLSNDHQEDHMTRSSSSSSEDIDVESDAADHKLTRAQRKRLRKKKLKENALQRRKIVGPLLPPLIDHVTESCSTSVRHNADKELNTPTLQESAGCSNSSKLKLRRKAKRQSKERGKTMNSLQ